MSDGSPDVGDVIGGKYEIEATIGRGGMGAVFRARHTLTDRPVALKWLIPSAHAEAGAVQRFLREARAMGRIDHPNVVGVLDVGMESDSAFLVMELLRGASLRAYIEEDQRIDPARAIALLLPALDGVIAAHRAGVVHRDLKPENLFAVTDEDGRVTTTKVLDFGISKLRDDKVPPGSDRSITQTGTTMGTPSYMSPEQVRGARDVDARTDVWALGAILYEMLSGRVPFRAETYGGLMVAIVTDAHVPVDVLVPELPDELARVIDRALEKDPDRRIPDVESLRAALASRSVEAAPAAGAPLGAKASPAGPTQLAPSGPASARPSRTPTRVARPARSDAPEESVGALPIELASGAQRSPGSAPVANASVPLSVPDLPITGARPRGTTGQRLFVTALAIACVVPIAAVVAHSTMRGSEAGGRPEPVAPVAPVVRPLGATVAPAPDAGIVAAGDGAPAGAGAEQAIAAGVGASSATAGASGSRGEGSDLPGASGGRASGTTSPRARRTSSGDTSAAGASEDGAAAERRTARATAAVDRAGASGTRATRRDATTPATEATAPRTGSTGRTGQLSSDEF